LLTINFLMVVDRRDMIDDVDPKLYHLNKWTWRSNLWQKL